VSGLKAARIGLAVQTILVTGFEPFGDERENPSAWAAERAAAELAKAGFDAHSAVLPVSYKRCGEALAQLLERLKPSIAVALGLAGGITHVRLERVAINLMDASRPDNDGAQPVDEPIDPQGPAAYFSTLPLRRILERLRGEGVPAAISNSAGTFLCNYAMYLLLRHADVRGYPKKAGFIHLPYTPEIASRKPGLPASLPLSTQARAVVIAVEEAAASPTP
jgi:pyroglutamyl-peptidase